MADNCEYIYIYIMSSLGELIKGGLPDWWLNEGTKPPYRKKISMLQNVTQSPGLGQIFWNDLSKGKWARGLLHRLCNKDRGQGC
jgi:hypothetical protein